MARLANKIATVMGLGYAPSAPGTWGSAAGLVLAKLAQPLPDTPRWALLAVLFVVAVAASSRTERDLGTRDPSVVVIDECWAMWLITALVPASLRAWPAAVAAFALFRLFDILKPPPLKRLARCPAGWGIMLDDLGAALYAAGLLQLGLMLWPSLA